MTSVEAAEAAVEKERQQVVEAHEVYLQSLAEQWRELATQRVRELVVNRQPERRKGIDLTTFKSEVEQLIDDRADKAPELFRAKSDPEQLVKQARTSRWNREGNIRFEYDGYKGPVETLAQPLHDLLKRWGYNPDLIKARQAITSSTGFNSSDFPLPSYEVTATYVLAIRRWAQATETLEVAKHDAASERAAAAWDDA